jgi:hypothetical protein
MARKQREVVEVQLRLPPHYKIFLEELADINLTSVNVEAARIIRQEMESVAAEKAGAAS